ncbi:MAG: hypothetical protein Q9163_000437 [Psora crenata]
MSRHRPVMGSRSTALVGDDCNQDGTRSHYTKPPPNILTPAVLLPSDRSCMDVTAIGLALGSPGESPLHALPSEGPAYFNNFPFPADGHVRPRADTAGSKRTIRDTKTKGPRWKTFGGLFSKRDAVAQPEAKFTYSLDQKAQQAWHTVPNQASLGTRKRAGSDKEKGMEMRKVRANRQMTRGPSILRKASMKGRATWKRNLNEIQTGNPVQQITPTQMPLAVNPPDTPRRSRIQEEQIQSAAGLQLLQVKIPNVELERYSVMFSGVLKSGLKHPSQTSLEKPGEGSFQGTEPLDAPLGVAPPFDELPRPHRQERSSSSSSRPTSPSFSLFPPLQSPPTRGVVNKPVPKPSPLSRSVTAPDTTTTWRPRPPPKTNKSEDLNQPLIIAPSRENIPVSKYNSHSRQSSQQSSHASKLSFDMSHASTASQSHVAKLSSDSSLHCAASPDRKPSFDPSLRSISDPDVSFLEAPEYPSNPSPSYAHTTRPTNTVSSRLKQAFHSAAFPARESSLNHPSKVNVPAFAPHEIPQQNAPTRVPDLELPHPPYASRNKVTHSFSKSVSSEAEVSIARQISIATRQRQLLIPVTSKRARQPLVPQVKNANGVDGGGRRSELVLLEQA